MKLIVRLLLGLLAVQGGCVGQDKYADPDTGATKDAGGDAKRDILEVLDDPAPEEPDANHDTANHDIISNHDTDENIDHDLSDVENTVDAELEDANLDLQDINNHDLMDDSEISDLSDVADAYDIPDSEDVIHTIDIVDLEDPDLVPDAAIDMNTNADVEEDTEEDVDTGEVQISGYDRCLAQYNATVEQALRDHPPDPEPEPTEEPPDTFTQVSLGADHGCALRTNGSIYCWGNNQYHQSEPPPEDHFVQVIAYENKSCALKNDGSLHCWGQNIPNLPNESFVKLSRGCGILLDGSIRCWEISQHYFEHEFIPGNFIDLSFTRDLLCTIDNQHSVQCWGTYFNSIDDRNFANTFDRNDYISISVNINTVCAETADHDLDCWGDMPLAVPGPVHLYKLFHPLRGIAILENNYINILTEQGDFRSLFNIPQTFFDIDRTQWVDVDINEKQHCAIDSQGFLQCWTLSGYKKQNLLYDRFLDYDFGCAVMQNRTLYCEEGEYDNFSRTTRILFDKVDFSSLVAKAGISQNQDVYYWADTFQGGPDESDVYYFQGPYENIVTEFEYFCGINESGNDECQCLCYPGYDICPIDCNERALFLYQNFHQIDKNCGVNNNGSINCWYFRDFEIYNTELNNQYAFFRFTGASFCGITCEGYIQCEGTQSYYNRGTIFKDIAGYNYPVQHFCSIDIFGKLSCESPEEIYTFNGKFSKLISSNNTFCAQRENGSVFCIGHQRGGK